MSTYTDLHNRVKENITVDYNNRVTPQRVRFFNEQNEYWGTFRGHVSAENINIDGGSLNGVTLNDVIINGSVALPDGIDLHKVLQQVKQISTDLIATAENLDIEIAERKDALEAEKDFRISADTCEMSQRQLKDSSLSIQIDLTNKDLVREISTLNIVLTRLDADISTLLNTQDGTISAYLNEQDRDLCAAISQEIEDRVFAVDKEIEDRTTAVEAEQQARIAADNSLSDAVVDSRADFGREVFDRTIADEKLELSIRNEVVNSIFRDERLCAALSNHIIDNEEQFGSLSIRVSDAIEHDRHYVIYTGSNTSKTTDSWPYSSKDYAVNIYNPKVNDGAVYFNAPNGERHEVGALYKINHSSLYPFTFKTLDGISHPGVASALVNNWSYGFSETQKSLRTELNGYNITFNDLDPSGQLSNFTFTVAPTLPQFHKVVLDGLMVGKVTDAYLSDYNENVLSGIMWIDTTDTDLATFNKFRCVSFNTTDLSVCDKMTERMTYLGHNTFKFEKNIDRAEYIALYDNLDPEHYQFARIYDSYNSIPGIISDAVGVTDINVRLGTPWSKLVNLNRDAEFKNIVEENVKFGDIYYDTVLSASVNDLSAKFDLVKVSELYKYNFNGIDGEGHEFPAGYVVPRLFNKKIKESTLDFDEVSACISDVMWVSAFKKTYTLTKSVSETLWTAEDVDLEGNTLNIKFNGMTLFVKVTSGTDGTIVRQEFTVLVDEPSIYNIDTCYNHVYTTTYVDISKYKEVYETPEATYTITMNAAVESESFPRYELNIDTAVTDLLKIQVPERTSDDISREFKVLIKPDCLIDKLVELEFVDANGNHVQITNNRHQKVLIPTNKWTLLQLNEINSNVFFVKDLDDNEDAHDVEFLSNAISVETASRIANDGYLSDTIELSVGNLQTQVLDNDADIADIYERIRGGINYKGKVFGELRDSSSTIVEISAISNLFVWNTHHYSVNGYTEDTVLSNGFMYIMQTLDGSTKYKFNIEGIDIEDRDYVIINCRGTDPDCNGKAVKDLTSADIDIIDAEDADVIHRPELTDISVDLQGQIEANDADIAFLSDEVSTIHWIELSGFNFLSDTISTLCGEISNVVELSVLNLQTQIAGNDDDIDYLSGNVKFLLSVDRETINYKGTLPYLSNLEDPVSHEDLGYNYLSTYILQDMGIHAPGRLKLGDLFRVSAVQSCLYDAAHNACYFGANDYFTVNKDIMVSDVTSADFDVIRDAKDEVEKLSSITYLSVENLQSQILANDSDISFLSAQHDWLSGELSAVADLSVGKIEEKIAADRADISYLSGQHDWLSSELSNVMDLSVANLQGQVAGNDNDIAFLSGLHDWLSDEISNVMDLSVANLQGQVAGNDNDIEFLSGLHDWLSDEISNVTTLSIQNLQGQVIANDNDIEFLSDIVELTISSDLYELSAGTKETSAMLSDLVKALWNDVRGGVNYKGHLKSYRDTEHLTVDLSDIYLHSFAEYTADTKLNNGWLYCFTTDEASKKYTTKDGIELEHRDYIVIHSHSDLSSIPVSDIGRDTVDIIDTADDDYVRLNLLAEVSNALSTDYVGKIEALTISLSTTVSNDIDFLSSLHDWLSDEISTVVGLSVENLEGKIASDRADISYLSGQHDWLSGKLSTTMDLSVKNLLDLIADNDTDITNIQSYISGGNSLCTELSTVKYHYNKTFIEDDYILGPDHKVDVLKIVNSANTTDTFKLIYLSGTLVLESLPAPEHEVEIEE